jgi:hypothetical protein
MITVRLKVNSNKFSNFLKIIENLEDDMVTKIDYKIPKPKTPKVIYKAYNLDTFTSFEDLEIKENGFFYKSTKVKTIQLIANYQTFMKVIQKIELNISSSIENEICYKLISEIESSKDDKFRLERDKFKPKSKIIEFNNLTSIIITQNIPLLFDMAMKHKKSKEHYCLITIVGLHQIEDNKIMNKILRIVERKTFKLYKVI